jgi:hypothetical protein
VNKTGCKLDCIHTLAASLARLFVRVGDFMRHQNFAINVAIWKIRGVRPISPYTARFVDFDFE